MRLSAALLAVVALTPLSGCGARSALREGDGASRASGTSGTSGTSSTSTGASSAGCTGSAIQLTVDGAAMTFASSCAWEAPPSVVPPVAFAQELTGDPSSAGLVIQGCASSAASSPGISFATDDAFAPGTYTAGSFSTNQAWDIEDGSPFTLTITAVGPVGGRVTGTFAYGVVQADFSVCRVPDAAAPSTPPHP